MGPHETAWFGDSNATVSEMEQEDETREESNLCHEDDSGAGRSPRGYGSASLIECLSRIGQQQNNTTNAATCFSVESNIGNLPQADPRQVLSPNSGQTLPQDPVHVQDPSWVETYLRPEEPSSKCKKEETPSSAPKRKEFDVKKRKRNNIATGAVR